MKTVALIPARAGSKRVPGKNIRDFCGHPLLAYAIQSAIDAEIFDGIYVSSDSWDIGRIAISYGAVFIERPSELALDASPDSDWIDHAKEMLEPFDYFAIVRPTNPFRTGETIKRAWKQWNKTTLLKAVEPVSQHPGKMWRRLRETNKYLQSLTGDSQHLFPLQNLEQLYIQNASLEFRAIMATYATPICGNPIQSFFTEGFEGFDINTELDWMVAEMLVEKGLAKLPTIRRFSI